MVESSRREDAMSARYIAFAALVVGAGHLAMCEADAQGPASFARRIRDITSVVLAEQLGTRLAPKQPPTLPLGPPLSVDLSPPPRLPNPPPPPAPAAPP